MYYVYVLRSLKNGRFYTGSTNNLSRRMFEHNLGKNKYTRLTKPFKLIYFETYKIRKEAVGRERYLKTGKGRNELKEISRA